jgi:hypothetical protein
LPAWPITRVETIADDDEIDYGPGVELGFPG